MSSQISKESNLKTYLFPILIFFGILLNHPGTTQSSIVDSLTVVLAETKEDSKRVDIMNDISSRLTDKDPTLSMSYARKALRMSQGIGNKEQEVKALHNIGVALYDSSEERDSSLGYFLMGEKMAKENNLPELQADHLMRLANWYRYHQKDSTKAMNYFLESLEISKAANYHYGTARTFAKLASFYTRYKQIPLCKEYLDSSAIYYLKTPNGIQRIAHYHNEVGNKIWDYDPKVSMVFFFKGMEYSKTHPNLNLSMANAYLEIGEPEKALQHLKVALPYLELKTSPRAYGIAIAKMAEVHLQLKEYEEALKTCDNGISQLKLYSTSSQSALPALFRTKGILKELQNEHTQAVDFFQKSIDEGYRINEPFEVYKSNITLGNFYFKRKSNKAEKHCLTALNGAKENNYTNLEIAACECLYKIHKGQSEHAKALSYFEKRNQLQDSLSTLKIQHSIDINNQIAEKDIEIAQESYLKELNKEQLKSQFKITRILLFSSFIGLILIGLLSVGMRRIAKQNVEITRKTNELSDANDELERSNGELERFAHIASHDLKSPLKSIVSFAGLLRRKLKNKVGEDSLEHITFIENSGARMTRLIDDILDYSKLSSKAATSKELIPLNEVVDEISQLINNKYKAKPAKIEASTLPNIKWNQSQIFLLFKNLIENGLKYNESEQPMIKLSYLQSDGMNVVQVEDNGIGIDKDYHDKIFDKFSRLHGQGKYEGTGLGLATCKKIVNDFGGEIELSSQLGKGTIFKIDIPEDLITQN